MYSIDTKNLGVLSTINGSLDTAGQSISEPEVVTIGTTQNEPYRDEQAGENKSRASLSSGTMSNIPGYGH